MGRPFQFRLKGILWATFWMAVALTSTTILEPLIPDYPPDLQNPFRLILFLAIGVTLSLAIGALFDKAATGLAIGLAIGSVILLFLTLRAALINGWL